jgi:hypothetical protein
LPVFLSAIKKKEAFYALIFCVLAGVPKNMPEIFIFAGKE